MTKIVKMSEKNASGMVEQFFPETHVDAVKDLVNVTEEDKQEWSAKETTTGSQLKATKALNDAKAYVDNKQTLIWSGTLKYGDAETTLSNSYLKYDVLRFQFRAGSSSADGRMEFVVKKEEGQKTGCVFSTMNLPDSGTGSTATMFEARVLLDPTKPTKMLIDLDIKASISNTVSFEPSPAGNQLVITKVWGVSES
ncbi:hypothetical protein [Listeria seeligeri]|uniref:hypothetical protein n=1 Tax=Listeria seeligeri TaxID=1640 RepID=UPI0016275682|nr:hypothetical protein [Listeria seeligeri]MBC1423890.1 hypothetical protein [Listeria seeligeri]MBC1429896.1 hypothetical protein [Listeria seeligeri]MBC1470786.1 hypothetical protein [Listeria seeligeri]MBC1481123.1 hypothetical protein [Listeria seeligeri]MBC1527244.1 hypothetical protein [Listeria seeligeri]